MKFAVAVLLGAVSAQTSPDRPVWGLRSTLEHRTDAGIQKDYGDASVKAANERDPQSSALMQMHESDSSDSSDSDSDDDFVQTQ